MNIHVVVKLFGEVGLRRLCLFGHVVRWTKPPTVRSSHSIAAQEAPLRLQLQAKTRSEFSKSWSLRGSRFHELQMFVAGLATMMPT